MVRKGYSFLRRRRNTFACFGFTRGTWRLRWRVCVSGSRSRSGCDFHNFSSKTNIIVIMRIVSLQGKCWKYFALILIYWNSTTRNQISRYRFQRNEFRRGITFHTAFHYDFAVFIGFQIQVFGLSYIVTIILSWEIIFSNYWNKTRLHMIYKPLDCKILSHLSNSCSIGSLQNVDLLSPLQQRAAEVVGMYLQLYGK